MEMRTTTRTNGGAAVTLDDLYNLPEALDYINAALVDRGGRPLTAVGFKRHLYSDELFQMEPIRVGRRPGHEGDLRPERAMGIVFTRRMLDDYLANREHNAQRGVERRVTRPTDAEREAVMSWSEAREWLNAWFARRRLSFRLTERSFNTQRSAGKLRNKVVGKSAVYLRGDMETFAREMIHRLNGRERPVTGRPAGARDVRRRTRRSPAEIRREAIFEWLGKTPDELRAELDEESVSG